MGQETGSDCRIGDSRNRDPLGAALWAASRRTAAQYPLYAALLLGGLPLVIDLLGNVWRREFGSDLLAGISIVTAVLLGEYLGRHVRGVDAFRW